jgi:methionyl-tRNA synthetase
LHVSGSDAHGTRIEYEALLQGITPKELAERVHQQILRIIDEFEIDIDNYTTTESPVHKRFVQEIYKKMDKGGYIFPQEEQRAYCENCRRFLADRFIEGTCPHCGFEEAKGNQCDSCGVLLEPEELKSPRCTVCGKRDIIFKQTRHWYLDLKKLEPQLRSYIASRNWSSNVLKFTEGMLNDLRPRAVTRDISWGIPAPFEGSEGKVIYVWAEAALGYVSATQEYFIQRGEPDGWKEFWFGDDIKQVYTQAKDNIPFHTLIFPGQLIASGEGYHLPDQISAQEYLNWIGGQQFSKSRGIGIYCDMALELLEPVYWRFYLLYIRPERKDVNFSWEELDKIINGVFINNISNLVNRVIALTVKLYQGQVPQASIDGEMFNRIKEAKSEFERAIESGLLATALRRVADLAVVGNEYFQREKPWEGNKPEVIASAVHLIKAMAIMLEPFVPSFSKEVYQLLNLKRPSFDDILKVDVREVGKAKAILEKLDVKTLKRRYMEMKDLKEGESPAKIKKVKR